MAESLVWIYNNNTGLLWMVPSSVAAIELKTGAAWHGPFVTKDDALKWFNEHKIPGWKDPTGNVVTAVENAGSSIKSTVTGAAENAITGNLDKFGPWFIRIGEVLLGLVLIGVGLAKLTGTTNLIAKTAKAVIP